MADKNLKRQFSDLEADPSFVEVLDPPQGKKAKTDATPEAPATEKKAKTEDIPSTPKVPASSSSKYCKDRTPTPYPNFARRQRTLTEHAETDSSSYSADDEASVKSCAAIEHETPRANVLGEYRRAFMFETTPGALYQGFETPPPPPEEPATAKPRVSTPYPVCAYPSQYFTKTPPKLIKNGEKKLETFQEEDEISSAPEDPDKQEERIKVVAASTAPAFSADIMVTDEECIRKLKVGINNMVDQMIQSFTGRCEDLRTQLMNDMDGYLNVLEAHEGATKLKK